MGIQKVIADLHRVEKRLDAIESLVGALRDDLAAAKDSPEDSRAWVADVPMPRTLRVLGF